MTTLRIWPRIAPLVLLALGCGDDSSDSTVTDSGPERSRLEINVLFVHGVETCAPQRQNAERSFVPLEGALSEVFAQRAAEVNEADPTVEIAFRTARANLYTAMSSGMHPSESSDPLSMDDWEVGDGCESQRQGDPCTTAYEWRHRLVAEIDRLFGVDAGNIILVGHSTGSRVAYELAADVGPDGVGTGGWGVVDRIAAVVSIHGMVDAIGGPRYNVVGPFSFVQACRSSDPLSGFGSLCAMGNGWCEYAGDVSAVAASDSLGDRGRSLALIGAGDCSPSLFAGTTDGALPLDAQASERSPGVTATVALDQTVRVAHGFRYGRFCHSSINSSARSDHPEAIEAATAAISGWLFDDAHAVASSGTVEVETPLGFGQQSPVTGVGSSCPAGATSVPLTVAGRCSHPGLTDGDSHVVASDELVVADQSDCQASVSWIQNHDRDNRHAGSIYWKAHARDRDGGLVSQLR